MRVGIIDHHLANFHADTFLRLLRSGKYADVEVVAAWEMEAVGEEDWCKKQSVQRGATPEEVVAQSDALMVLAPDNFEVHRDLACMAVAAGKPVFVDKFLAPTLGEARDIVEAAARAGAPLMSSSALRFAVEVEELLGGIGAPGRTFFARGMGNWEGYGVHTVAMAFRAVEGNRLVRVRDVGKEEDHLVVLDFGERLGSVEVRQASNQYEVLPWQLGVRIGDRYAVATVKDYEAFYARLIDAVVEFFRTGQSPTSVGEMLDVVAVLHGARISCAHDGAWVTPSDLL